MLRDSAGPGPEGAVEQLGKQKQGTKRNTLWQTLKTKMALRWSSDDPNLIVR